MCTETAVAEAESVGKVEAAVPAAATGGGVGATVRCSACAVRGEGASGGCDLYASSGASGEGSSRMSSKYGCSLRAGDSFVAVGAGEGQVVQRFGHAHMAHSASGREVGSYRTSAASRLVVVRGSCR